MAKRASRLVLATLLLSGFASHAYSQSTRFHLHKETSASGNGVRRLNTAAPECDPIGGPQESSDNVTAHHRAVRYIRSDSLHTRRDSGEQCDLRQVVDEEDCQLGTVPSGLSVVSQPSVGAFVLHRRRWHGL